MATWAEFAAGPAEVQVPMQAGQRAPWRPFDGGGAALARAGERLLFGSTDVALLGTVAPSARPRIHPFIPRIVEGRLWAFAVEHSPKRRDLERHGQYTIHASLAAEDEEFWVAGRARREDGAALRAVVAAAMPYSVHDWETLFEFDLEIAGLDALARLRHAGASPGVPPLASVRRASNACPASANRRGMG